MANMLKCILVCMMLTIIGLGLAQEPQHCFSPPELTLKSMSFNHRLSEFSYYDVEYDAHNQRVAARGDSTHGSHSSRHWIIMLHKERTIYEIDIESKTCHKFPFKNFVRFGIPEHAKFEDTYVIGGPGESVEVEEWFESHLVGGKAWVGVFSRKHCYPVSSFLLQNHHNESTTSRYSNIVEGIANPDWFIPPQVCHDATWAAPGRIASDFQGHVGWF